MKKKTIIKSIIAFSMLATSSQILKAQDSQNPFLVEYNTPFGVPPFDKIKPEHFMPAFEQGIKEQEQRISAIYKQRSKPTFENTIAALERSGELLDKVSTVFFNLTSANTSSELEEISKKIAPKLSKSSDDIFLNGLLFQRVKSVYDQRTSLNLNQEQNQLLDKTYKAFVRSGANLNAAQQKRMREINSELSLLTLSFGQHLLKEVNKFELLVDNEKDLKGLPESLKAAAKNSAEDAGKAGKWRFTLQNPSVMPFLEYADNRYLREVMYKAYTNKGNNGDELDNNEVVSKITNLRAEKANLLGYASHADYVLQETMAKTPKQAYDLLDGLWKAALPIAKQEAQEMQKMLNADSKDAKLAGWDWFYYANKIKDQKYSYNAEELRPYFKLENVKEGIFYVSNRLFGITFTEIKDIPKYHEDVIAYEVKEANGEHIGVFYMDFHPRDTKRGGAWMISYRSQYERDGKQVKPIVSIVCNFTSPNGDEPALLTPDETSTFFHEVGHALHGLLSNVKHESLSGTSVSRDFVELPSQFMEHYAFEPEVLNVYAKHYKTGEVVPAGLLEKMNNASKFNQGFETVEYLAASFLDLDYHTLSKDKKVKPADFEKEQMNKLGLIPEIAPRYRSTYFQHVFSGGYSAGYYSYIWSAVLDNDAFAAFKEAGNIFDPSTSKSYRKNILEKGGTEEPMNLYKAFRGREPEVKYLLKKRGLEKPL